MNMLEVEVAVVTGAARGIGLAIAERIVAEGHDVVGVDLDETELSAVAQRFGTRFHPVVGDIAQWDTHERAADAAEALGRLSFWVNNAGIDAVGGAHEVTQEGLTSALGVLQVGPMFGCAIAVRRMLANRSGSIVNVSSIQGVVAFPRYFAYQAAKAALIMVSKGIAVDYGHLGIRCNALLPGVIDTPMTRAGLTGASDMDAAMRDEGLLSPMTRAGTAAEVANAAWFLLSSESSYVSGSALVADGAAIARCFPYAPGEL